MVLPGSGICSEHNGSAGSAQSKQARNTSGVLSEPSHSLLRLPAFRTCHSSLDFRTNFVVGLTIRGEILKSLIRSEKLLETYIFDQSKYLEGLKTPGLGLEQDTKYFWIFSNLDYGEWVQYRGVKETRVLGLHGPPTEDLELAASHIVRSLRGLETLSQEGEVPVLYFFYNSTGQECGPQNVVGWRDLICVWSLLRQLIESRPTAARSLLQIFLRKTLYCLNDEELGKSWAHDPTIIFESLLCLSKPRNLWDAFGLVLGYLKEKENPNHPGNPNLTLIIVLDSKSSTWKELIDNIRKMTAGLPRGYGTVRVLLSDLPEASNLHWQRPSEILLEYDKERQGM